MANKFNLDGFSVSTANVCTASGGFSGSLTGNKVTTATGAGKGVVVGSSAIYESAAGELEISASATVSISTASGITLDADGQAISIGGANINVTGIPTSDPVVAGQLWSDGGTLKVSAGA